MVCGGKGAVGTWFPLSGWAANNGVIRGSWRAVDRSGTVYERGGNLIVIVSSAGEEMAVRGTSLGLGLWSCLLERGLGIGDAEELVVGGEDRSTLGPASDMRGRIRDLLVRGQDRGRCLRRLGHCHRMTEGRTRLN